MGPAFYIMAILGCGDAGASCQQVRVIETRYATPDACSAAMSATLMEQSDVSFPEVMAECRPGKGSLAGTPDAPRG